MMTQERLMALVSALIDLLLASTDNAALVESCIRSLGFTDEKLRLFGFDV